MEVRFVNQIMGFQHWYEMRGLLNAKHQMMPTHQGFRAHHTACAVVDLWLKIGDNVSLAKGVLKRVKDFLIADFVVHDVPLSNHLRRHRGLDDA